MPDVRGGRVGRIRVDGQVEYDANAAEQAASEQFLGHDVLEAVDGE